ncbi:MAG: molybdopterin-dependent oxidoreductase [Hyphomicrobiales bacterium]
MYVATHWGTYRPIVKDGMLVGIEPAPWDREPSPIGKSLPGGIDADCRVRRPAVRQSFLTDGPASRERRGSDPFVEISWERAIDIVAAELDRVRKKHGNQAIFGGSYGWSSAGRFHHAQSQVHRFLNALGGYTFHKDTYSSGAARRALPHVLGEMEDLRKNHTTWRNLAEHCQMFVAFGGLPVRNSQVHSGGANDHAVPHWIRELARRGVEFVNISPVRDDLDMVQKAEWLPIRPGSDTALILALCHVLITEDLHDRDFVARCTVGFDRFADYVLGKTDGQPKTCEWAAGLTDIPAAAIHGLARRMAGRRTMVNMTWSLQRAIQGEQPYFAIVALAALLGQIGTPGGGLGLGYACGNDLGSGRSPFSGPRLPQGTNKVRSFIPVARIADLLLNPGAGFDYDGKRYTYPDIRLVYWAGGNVFHHHQDINRLIGAWRRPETVITQESYWTAQAKFSDIVLPATTMMERDDIGSSFNDGFMIAMKRSVEPVGEARDDYAIFAAIAGKLGAAEEFTEGRGVAEWLAHLYEESRARAEEAGLDLPPFETFWEMGHIEYPWPATDHGILLEGFRQDPKAHPLETPSGLIELFSERVAGFCYPECPGHPYWQAHEEMLGSARSRAYPLHMLSNQPSARLHSQYDHGSVSLATKIHGREPVRMNSADAARRGLAEGDVVRVFNDRGAMLAGLAITDAVRPGVLQIATGAWYDPLEPGQVGTLDKHGNPNMLTPDIGTSRLAQGCSAQSALVEVEKWQGDLPEITAFSAPAFAADPTG